VIPVELAAPDKRTRAEARNRLKPMFETVLNLLGEPQIIA
jgi:hypothetical protein